MLYNNDNASGMDHTYHTYQDASLSQVSCPTRMNVGLSAQISLCLKRTLDFSIALGGLVLLSPIFFIIALFVVRDGGPVLFRHRRIGRHGVMFDCLKFRSMAVNSPLVLQQLLDTDPVVASEWAATQKLRVDPRVTAVGSFLRATSLDEIPQLFNIVLGQMSLVGPRPIVEAEAQRYANAFESYLSVRPGLTGPWQISGRSDTSYAQRVRLDVEYALGWSIWTDFGIMFKTVWVVLLQRGAV